MPKATDLLSSPQKQVTAPLPATPVAPVRSFSPAVRAGKIDQFPDDEVDYELVAPNHQFTETSVMVPLASSIKGARTFIASKYATQALPIVNPDSPLVDTLDDETQDGYTKTLGHKLGLRKADVGGVVKKVSESHIDLDGDDGKTARIELKRYFPNNKKTYTTETPTVSVGDRITKGQPVARSNYVDGEGRLALGKNLAVAFMPAPGGSTFEDAIEVSESAARKLTSPHLFGFDVEHKHGVASDKNKFISLFPNKYTNEQLAKLDSNGMVKPGVKIEPGDPVILSFAPRSLSSKDAALGNLSKVLRKSYQDLSQTWDKSTPGVVAHAVPHRTGLNVQVATNMPLQEGDKICMTPDHEVLTTQGWIPIDQVQVDDYVYSLDPENGKIKIEAVSKLFCFQVKNEQMYSLETTQVSMCVTNNHKLVAAPRNFHQFGMSCRQYGLIKASDLSGKRYRLKRDGEFCAPDLMKIVIDPVQVNLGGNGVGKGMGWSRGFEFDGDIYAWLVGAYLSEGNLVHDVSSGSYGIELTQIKPKGVEVLKKKLDESGVKWGHRTGNSKFVILGKALYEHFLQFGCRSWKKVIPRGIFDMFSKRQFGILLEGLMWGDGNVSSSGSWHYHTSSPQLADDVQQLALLAGYSATIDHQKIGIDFDPKGGVIDGRQIMAKRDRYILSILKHKNSPEVNHGHSKKQGGQIEQWVDYTGPIYCIEVPQNHTFYVRRNGKPHWTGNSARSGAKGVVSRIVPDDQMIRSKNDGPLDILINPAALIGRVNPGMVFEALLGKIAHKHGKRYNLPSFSEESYRDYVENELKAHGEHDTEELEDPHTGNAIPNVITGRQFFMKLEHMSEGKISGRGEGGSDVNEQPTKGGDEGAKRLGGLQNYAILSHGADHVLEDAHVYRGSANPEMWRRFRLGETLPAPKQPFIYDKFLNSLKAAGVNVRPDEKGRLKLFAMTDRDVDGIARHEVQVPETISHKDGSPIKGGLMDFSLHGGPEGKGWSYIKLDDPMPSPVMEEPIRRLLGLTEKQMRGVIAGTDTINGRRGPQALHDALSQINLDKLIETDKETIRLGKKTKRDDAVRRINFALGLKKSGIEPNEMMITKVPVIPPAYRPVIVMGDMHLTSDANYLYKDLMSSRNILRSNRSDLADDDLADERLAIYDSIKAIQGMGDPINIETANKGVKGFIKQIAGVGGPKCYDDETEVLTENGWVPFPEYKDASVKVATLNPTTRVMEFQNPSDILHEPYEGSMVRTKTSKLDLLVTEGHWHYVEQCIKRGSFGRGRGKRTREWQPAKKIQAGDLVGKTQRHRYVVSADNFSGETPQYSFENCTPNKEAFSQFVGWWIAEGFLTFYKYKKKNLPRSAVIAVKDGTSDVARIDDMFERLGLQFGRRVIVEKKGYKMKPIGYKTVLWRISNRDLAAWLLKNCGSGAENKKISTEILRWRKEDQHLLLGAYLDGDGEQRATTEGKGKTYFNMSEVVARRSRSSTTSLELVNNIERICLQTGLGFRLTDEFFEDHKTWKKQYRFRIYGYNRVVVEYRDQTQRIENWSGMVHCVTVPNGLIFVRRNGRHVVSGNSGMFVSKVIGHPVNAVGRSVIVPNADLNMDQVGIPHEMAWKMFAPMVMRSMVREGMPAVEAAKRVENPDAFAHTHLLKEMERRPVMYSRDPALHRFSIMGGHAVLVPGNNIHLSPLVVKPFGADFDGDQMNIHVPITDKAVQDVKEKMLPSKNLFGFRGKNVHYLPSQEFILGLFGATRAKEGAKPVEFGSVKEALEAYRTGSISIDHPITIK